ncbi:MAG: hypothetical protein MSH58_00620 [Clostridiales bacterium]|nr:hypothetical protein [Clostridiales bacterium]
MNDDLEILEALFQTKTGAYRVCTAMYKNEPCYCVTHIRDSDQYTVLFEYDKEILKAVIQRLKRTKMTMDNKKSGSGFIFKFHKTSHEAALSLRTFLWAKYNNLPLKKAKGLNLELSDKSSFSSGIMDMRKANIYDAGGTSTSGISVISHPETGNEFIVAHDRDRIECMDYSPELYQMLTTRRICGKPQKCPDNGRLCVRIHFAQCKDGWTIKNLSRFILLYHSYFGRYANYKSGAVTRFIHNIPSLENEVGTGKHCAHLNAQSWNDCKENLLFMDDDFNQKMSNYASRISGAFEMLPIVWRSGNDYRILIEWSKNGEHRYLVCNCVEDYLDFQETVFGVNGKIGNLQINLFYRDGRFRQEPTPKQSAKPRCNTEPPPDMDTILSELQEWSNGKDRILQKYQESPECFWVWRNTQNPMAIDVFVRQILRML